MNILSWLFPIKRQRKVLLVREDMDGDVVSEWLPEPEAHELLLNDPDNGKVWYRAWIVVDDEEDMSFYGRSV